MGFSRQKYWSGLPFPSPGDLPDSGIEPGLLALQVDYLLSQPPGKPVVREKKQCNENNRNCDRYFGRKVKPDKWSLCPHGASWGRIETRAKVSWLTKPSRNCRTDCNTSTQEAYIFMNSLLLLLEKLIWGGGGEAVLGRHCYACFFLVVGSRGYSAVAVLGLLAAVASVVEHRLWGTQASVVAAPGLRAQAQ